MPVYRHGQDVYDIPDEEIEGFEAQFPEATVEMHDGEDIYDIPVSEKEGFLSQYPTATYSQTKPLKTAQPIVDAYGMPVHPDVSTIEDAPKMEEKPLKTAQTTQVATQPAQAQAAQATQTAAAETPWTAEMMALARQHHLKETGEDPIAYMPRGYRTGKTGSDDELLAAWYNETEDTRKQLWDKQAELDVADYKADRDAVYAEQGKWDTQKAKQWREKMMATYRIDPMQEIPETYRAAAEQKWGKKGSDEAVLAAWLNEKENARQGQWNEQMQKQKRKYMDKMKYMTSVYPGEKQRQELTKQWEAGNLGGSSTAGRSIAYKLLQQHNEAAAPWVEADKKKWTPETAKAFRKEVQDETWYDPYAEVPESYKEAATKQWGKKGSEDAYFAAWMNMTNQERQDYLHAEHIKELTEGENRERMQTIYERAKSRGNEAGKQMNETFFKGAWSPGQAQSAGNAFAAWQAQQPTTHTLKAIEKANEVIEAYRNHQADENFFIGAFKGMKDGLSDIDNWTGVYMAGEMQNLYAIADKMEKGEALTQDEEDFLDAQAYRLAIEASLADDLGWGYKSGNVTGASIPFMLQMLASPVSVGAEGSINAINKGFAAVGKRAIKKFGKTILRRTLAMPKGLEMAGKALNIAGKVAKPLSRIVGKVADTRAGQLIGKGLKATALATEAGVAQAFLFNSDKMVADAMERHLGNEMLAERANEQYGTNLIAKEGEEWVTAGLKALASMTAEQGSEFLGTTLFEPLGKMIARSGAGREIGDLLSGISGTTLMRAAKNSRAGAALRLMSQIKGSKVLDEIMGKAQWNGLVGEYLEEVANGTVSVMLGDIEAEKFASAKHQAETILGLAWTSGALGVLRGGQRVKMYAKAHRLLADTDRTAQMYFRHEDGTINQEMMQKWEQFKASLEGKDMEGMRAELSRVMDDIQALAPTQGGMNIHRMRLLMDYMKGYAYLMGISSADNADEQELTAEQEQAETALAEGMTADTPEAQADIVQALAESEKRLGEVLGTEDVDLWLDAMGETAEAQLEALHNDTALPDETKQAAEQYLNDRLRYEGVRTMAEEEVESRVNSAMAEFDQNTNKDTGKLTEVRMKDESTAYVVAGSLEAGGNIYIRYADGRLVHAAASDVVEVLSDQQAQPVRDMMAEGVRQQAVAEIAARMQAEQQRRQAESTRHSIPANETVPAEETVAPTESAAPVEEAATEDVAAPVEAAATEEAAPREDADYEAMTPEEAVDDLWARTQEDEEVMDGSIQDTIEQMQQRLAEAEAAPIAAGANMTERIANRQAHNAAVAQAKASLEHWQKIAAMAEQRKAERAAQTQEAEELNQQLERQRQQEEQQRLQEEQQRLQEEQARIEREQKAAEQKAHAEEVQANMEQYIAEAEAHNSQHDVREISRQTGVEAKRIKRILDWAAEHGVKIDFENYTTTGEHGQGQMTNANIVSDKRRIVLNKGVLSDGTAIEFIAGHELTHQAKADGNMEAWENLRKATIEAMGQERYDREFERTKRLYRQAYRDMSEQDLNAAIEEEVVADWSGMIFLDPEAIDKMRNVPKTFAQKVYTWLKGFFYGDTAKQVKDAISAWQMLAEGKELTGEAADRERHSIVGITGARALDKAEGTTVRMDNMDVAEEMEAAGKDAETIWMATGWERGADGKWKYDANDYIPEFVDNTAKKQVYEDLIDAKTKEYEAATNPTERHELRMKIGEYMDKSAELSQYFVADILGEDHPLIKAYPDLGNITIEFDPNTENCAYYPQIDRIELGTKNEDAKQNARNLAHELQHAIQHTEGFATGASTSNLNERLKKKFEAITAQIEQFRAEGRNEEADALIKQNKGLAEAVINNEGDVFGNYMKVAGEVEARNASARQDMTPEERRQTSPSKSEDIAREEQIVLEDEGREEQGLKYSVTPEERMEMEARILDWLSEENLTKAAGMTREQIFEEFGNQLEPIAYLPMASVRYVGDNLTDERIYSGKGYFIDHAMRNHAKEGKQTAVEDIDVSKYLNIQNVLDNPDSIKETFVDGKRTVIFIKKIGRYFAELTQVEENGKIVLHKSFFNQKKEPYAKLADIRSISPSLGGGVSPISHADDAAPAISLQSRNDDELSASKDTQSVSTEQTDKKEISEKSAESNVEVTNEEVASLPKNEGEQALFSISTYEQQGREILEAYVMDQVSKGRLTQEQADDIISEMEDIYNICVGLKDKYVPFGNWSEAEVIVDEQGKPVFSVIKANGDYAMNLDFSLVCKKRRTLDAVLREMIDRGIINNYVLGQVDMAKINDIIRQHGFETACRLCFVDAKRFRVAQVADVFCEMYNALVDKSDAQLKKISKKEGKSVPGKIARMLLEHPENSVKLSRENFMDSKGFEDMTVNKEAIMKLYNAKKGTGGPKASYGDTQYLNDILGKQWSAEAAYEVGGVRLQSFSDYVPRMVFDYIQMVADLSAKGLPVHAYTKEPTFAKQFGLTGIKINLSLVPRVEADGVAPGLDANGEYVWQEGETFPYEEAIAIQNAEGYRENCGTIAVGVSDAHIEKMLSDDNIRMVIPYHKSGLNPLVAKHNNIDLFQDYTNEQNTRDANGNKLTKAQMKSHFNFNADLHKHGNPRLAAQHYLEWCDKKGYIPKFEKFREHPNYYKLLEDFTTCVTENGVDTFVPQGAVTMTFPNEESAFGSIAELIEEGLEEDAVLEGRRQADLGSIVDDIESEFAGGKKFSLSAEEQGIVDAAKADGTYMKAPNGEPTNLTEKQWAQVRTKAFKEWFGDWENDPENASKIVDENGEPMVVYHGSEEDFNVFDKTKGRANMDIQGMFFSPWEDDARGYGQNVRAFYLNIRKPANESTGYKALKRFQGQNGAGIKAREYLVSVGYDGLNNEDQEFVAFDSTQIKSATDNVGTFDAENADIRYSIYGGNKGYVGYSMSKRAANAREEGRFPKTDFKKEYGITDASLDALVEAGLIDNTEWHHTSVRGNRTPFYGWTDPSYADYYTEHKAEIDKAAREIAKAEPSMGDFEASESGMDEFSRKHQEWVEQRNAFAQQMQNEFDAASEAWHEQERVRQEQAHAEWLEKTEYENYVSSLGVPAEYDASNGVHVVTNGNGNPYRWEFYWGDKPAFRKYADAAREELKQYIQDNKGDVPSFEKWKDEQPRYSLAPISGRGVNESFMDYANRVAREVERQRSWQRMGLNRVLARDQYEERVASGWYQTQEALQDSMLGLKALMESIAGKGIHIEDIPDFENPYLGENRLSSVNQAESEMFARMFIKPMLEEIAKLARNEQERDILTNYAMAKHGLERNLMMATRDAQKAFADPNNTETLLDLFNKFRKKDYAGLTGLTGKDTVAAAEQEAQQMVDDYEQAHNTDELWAKIDAVNNAILLKQKECGLLGEKMYKEIRAMYDYYIPLRGFDEETIVDAYAYLDNRAMGNGSVVQRAQGRTSKADNPWAYLQSMADQTIMQGNRNKLVKEKLLTFVTNHPSDAVGLSRVWMEYDPSDRRWYVRMPKFMGGETSEQVAAAWEELDREISELAEQHPDLYKTGKESLNLPFKVPDEKMLKEHQVLVRTGAGLHIITINGSPRAAQAVNGQTNPDKPTGTLGAVVSWLEGVNRFMSQMYTSSNPDFIYSNWIRDSIYGNSMMWVKESPAYARRFNANWAKYNPKAVRRLLIKYKEGRLDMNNYTEALFHDFMMNGGETGYSIVHDIEAHKTAIKKEMQKLSGDAGTREAIGALLEKMEDISRAVENATRFAAFVTSMEEGRGIGRSIWDAKEVSVNFNKKGAGDKFWKANGQTKAGNAAAFMSGLGRMAYVFWNAALQGTTNTGRQLKRHPVKALSALAVSLALGYLAALAGTWDGDYDEEKTGEKELGYLDLPEYTRRSNMVIKTVKGHWLTIPLPIEYRALYGLGELAGVLMSGKQEMSGGTIAWAVAQQFMQVLPVDMLSGKNGWLPFVPSALSPLAQVLSNNKWTGQSLWYEPEDKTRAEVMPEWAKAYKGTDRYLVALTKGLSNMTGGDDVQGGWLDLNPAAIETLLDGHFGAISTMSKNLVKSIEMAAGVREYDPRYIPIWRRMVAAENEQTQNYSVNADYRELKETYDEMLLKMRDYQKAIDNGREEYEEKLDRLMESDEGLVYDIFEDNKDDIKTLTYDLREAEKEGDEEEIEEAKAALQELKRKIVEEIRAARKQKEEENEKKKEESK